MDFSRIPPEQKLQYPVLYGLYHYGKPEPSLLFFSLFTLVRVVLLLLPLNRVTYRDPWLLEAVISSSTLIYFWRMFLVFTSSALLMLIIRACV